MFTYKKHTCVLTNPPKIRVIISILIPTLFVQVKWKASKNDHENGGYDETLLREIFEQVKNRSHQYHISSSERNKN